MTSARRLHHTYADSLRLERDSPIKHECCDGEVFAMAGRTPEHGEAEFRSSEVALSSAPSLSVDIDSRYAVLAGM